MEPSGQVRGGAHRPDPGGPRQGQFSHSYVPTEDEKRVFAECNAESLWYRSLPFSAVGMFVTQILIKKGILTTHSKFGSLPKVVFAGFCGYIGGKFSYMKTCQEKLKRLENSPLGEALRKNKPIQPDTPAAAAGGGQPHTSKYHVDNYGATDFPSSDDPIPFSSTMNESSPSGITDGLPQEPASFLEERPKRKGITYDELRSRNREMYEAGITQKSEFPSKSSQEKPIKRDVKVNKYGDAWED
ncbi:OCIA domain-containing protein 1 isoform X2 [Zootoca vivipara]|uniref:OCIA domain-containing protein 1 isoform X2 n=1 Tax=Zootoca vivipara TaxID=8524 RepID=UPI00159056D2|nr:OCIA domain-containing protein 1 isoform X2 [Zootoca vivipara]